MIGFFDRLFNKPSSSRCGKDCLCDVKTIKVMVRDKVWRPRAEPFNSWHTQYFKQELRGDSVGLFLFEWLDYKAWLRMEYDRWHFLTYARAPATIELPPIDSTMWHKFCCSLDIPSYFSLPLEEQMVPPAYLP